MTEHPADGGGPWDVPPRGASGGPWDAPPPGDGAGAGGGSWGPPQPEVPPSLPAQNYSLPPGAPPGYGTGYGPQGYGPRNGHSNAIVATAYDGLAIASFVCGLLLLGIVPLGLGIASLVSIHTSKKRGAWMAIVGIVLGVVETAGYVWLVAFSIQLLEGLRVLFEVG